MRPEYVMWTLTNGSAVLLSHVSVYITWPVYCTELDWREFWSRDTDLYLTYLCFVIILTQFYVNFSRQEHQIDFLQVSLDSWNSQVSAYTPFHFSFTVPLRLKNP